MTSAMGVTELIESKTSREMIPADDKFNPVLSHSTSAAIKGFNGPASQASTPPPYRPPRSCEKEFLRLFQWFICSFIPHVNCYTGCIMKHNDTF